MNDVPRSSPDALAPAAADGERGPRIYNLFPLLAGPIGRWVDHLPRIAAMGFDWVYLNPIHASGFSGSLYAVKDPYQLDGRLRGDAAGSSDKLVRAFIDRARRHGLKVMLDLVVNHTAKDALLAEEHPEWYAREPDGSLHSPRAVDPDDPTKVTVWGDLAALDYAEPQARAALIEYWAAYVRHYCGHGVAGYRCDAAYQVPAEVWRALTAAARTVAPGCRFFAETLGCTLDQVRALDGAGFDFLFNSSKWWDFRAPWLLDQYNAFRAIAPSIAFPESHDTERLAAEVGSDPQRLAAHAKLRYLFAACFSTGVMMPMGYEYGFARKLDVVHATPDDWEKPRIDLTAFIAETNAMKASIPALNVEGPQRLVTAPHAAVVALLRRTLGDGSAGATLVLINPDEAEPHAIDPGPLLAATGGGYDRVADATPSRAPQAFVPGQPITLEPLELRVFRLDRAAGNRRPAADEAASRSRLDRLAANRIVIGAVYPEIDGGRHAIKRIVGDVLEVWADIFADGHDVIDACLKYREAGETEWREAPMALYANDRWVGRAPLVRNTRYVYTIEAWRDLFASWRAEIVKKRGAGHSLALELIEGRQLVEQAAGRAAAAEKTPLVAALARLDAEPDEASRLPTLLADDVAGAMRRAGPRTSLSRYRNELEVVVDRPAARFGAWFEIFPRSLSDDPERHATFDDVIAKLPYVSGMGFDVLYLTPIHPIGQTNRKGRNNALVAAPGDPGSPYAIGSPEGGHDAIHPQLGRLEDFRRLVRAAAAEGLEIALDFAIQCSPDHPWIGQYPEWFDWRPDGTIKFAENPPKKYEDIVNVHFYRQAFPAIWYALRDVVLFWAGAGVRIFRVDNPHTKPVPFWEWMIREVQDRYPDVIFLAEAFTRPNMMKHLAKVGFTQSYSYFTWRHTKAELTEYLTELTRQEAREYMRPNFFANTPDINPPILQTGNRAAFQMRAVLAATLSSAYGLYNGFELCEGRPVPGREEYLDSEKYELRASDRDRPGNIRDYLARLNRIRQENPALQEFLNLRFHGASDDAILFYAKITAARDNFVAIAVNLDPDHGRGGTIDVPLHELGLPDDAHLEVEDLFTGGRFIWYGRIQSIWLDPQVNPCAIWRLTPPGAPR